MAGILLLTWLLSVTPDSSRIAQHLVLSPLVGDTIDVVERERFGLFPSTQDFQYAWFEQDSAAGTTAGVVVTSRPDQPVIH